MHLFRFQATEDLMVEIAQDREQVDKVRAVVKREQEVTDFETRKVESVAYEAQKDLSAALPQLEAATAALDTLSMCRSLYIIIEIAIPCIRLSDSFALSYERCFFYVRH